MRRSTGATEPVFQGACRVTRPAGRARAQYGERPPRQQWLAVGSRAPRADAAQSELSVEPARSSPSHGARPGVKHRHRPEGCASAWPACPRRSTWNMAPDSAGVRSPLNARAHGHGRANPSDDPGSGPSGRGPSEQTPAPGDHPRAGLAGDASGLRFYPATSRPVERAVLAPRVTDGIRPLVTPRLTLWQVLPVHGAAGEGALPAVDIRVRVPRGTSRSGGGRRRRSGRHGAGCRSVACAATGADASNSGPGPRLQPPDGRWAVVAPCAPVCRLPGADDGWQDDPAGACSGETSPLYPLLSLRGGRLFRIRGNRGEIDDRQTDFRPTGRLFESVGGLRSLGSSSRCLSVATAPPAKSGPCDHGVPNSLSGAVQSGTEGPVGPNGERWARTPPISVWQRAEQAVRVRRCRSVAGIRAVPACRHYAVSGVPRGTSLASGQGGMLRCESYGARCQRRDAGDTGSGCLGLLRLSTPGYGGEAGAFSACGRCPPQPTGGRMLHARDGGSGCNRAVLSDDRPRGDRSTSECLSASWSGRRS